MICGTLAGKHWAKQFFAFLRNWCRSSIFSVQFGTGAVHVMPVGSCYSHENRCSESRSLLSAVKNILSFFFYIFLPIWKKSVQEMFINLYLLTFRLVKVVTVKAILYLGDVYAFLSVVSYEICT